MHILKATIIKDIKILLRDRVGLLMMFFMPILMVMVITSVQNSTFELVNNNKITMVIPSKQMLNIFQMKCMTGMPWWCW